MPGRPHVLHVDDDDTFLDLAAEFHDRAGFEATTTTDPERALDALEGVDCVVSDYEMPGLDGLELLECVQEREPELPFLLFTGKGSEEVASTAISAGVTDYVRKGGGETWTLLANRIERAISEYRTRRVLQKRADRFESIFQRHASPMLLIDPETGRIERANDAAVAFYGYERDALEGMAIGDINALPPDEVAARRRAADSGEENHFRFEHELADGEVREVDVYSTPVGVGGDEVLFSIVHDVSARTD